MRYIYGCRFAVWLLLPMETANMQAIQILRKRTQTIRSPKSSKVHTPHSDSNILSFPIRRRSGPFLKIFYKKLQDYVFLSFLAWGAGSKLDCRFGFRVDFLDPVPGCNLTGLAAQLPQYLKPRQGRRTHAGRTYAAHTAHCRPFLSLYWAAAGLPWPPL